MQKIRKISTNGSPAVHTVYALSYSDFAVVGISDDKFKNINTRLILPLFLVSQLGKKLNRILPIPGVYRKTVILCRERALSTESY